MVVSTAAAIIGGSIIAGGGAVLASKSSSKAASNAAQAQTQAADASIAEQRRQFDLSRADLAPFRDAGVGATNALVELFGLGGSESSRQTQPVSAVQVPGARNALSGSPTTLGFRGPIDRNALQNIGLVQQPIAATSGISGPTVGSGGSDPNLDIFFESPGFEFRQQQGEQAIERANAARGQFFSPGAVKGLLDFNSGLASQEFGNFVNQLNAIRTGGQTATATGVQAGAGTAANISNALIGAGDARASGFVGSSNALNQGIAGVTGAITGGINNSLLLGALNPQANQPINNLFPRSTRGVI